MGLMIQEALEHREVLNLFFGYYACSEIVKKNGLFYFYLYWFDV
jgi:hypothetical protein